MSTCPICKKEHYCLSALSYRTTYFSPNSSAPEQWPDRVKVILEDKDKQIKTAIENCMTIYQELQAAKDEIVTKDAQIAFHRTERERHEKHIDKLETDNEILRNMNRILKAENKALRDQNSL